MLPRFTHTLIPNLCHRASRLCSPQLHSAAIMSCLPQQNGVVDVVKHIDDLQPETPQTLLAESRLPPLKPTPCDQPDAIDLAAAQLRANQVIALPTDTIYGLACCANSETAIRRLYAIKGREQTKAVAICVAQIADMRHWGVADHLPDDLLQRLLPGPVTLVLTKRPEHLCNPYLNPGFTQIAIRIPDSTFIRRLCAAYRLPIALTSANRSAAQSTLNVHEFETLWPSLAAVFDGGAVGLTEEQRSGSTIVDLSVRGECAIVRSGVAAEETLRVIRTFGIRVV